MDNTFRSLDKKLRLLSEGEQIGLSPEEAAIYGIDYADEWPLEEDDEQGESYGE